MNETQIPDSSWITWQSHPASGTAYQESTAGEMTAARVVQGGHEVVSPDFDVDRAYRQYSGRVQRWIENDEILGDRETAADHAAWYDMDL